jgi:Ca2+-binding EF-hand superfamily protein
MQMAGLVARAGSARGSSRGAYPPVGGRDDRPPTPKLMPLGAGIVPTHHSCYRELTELFKAFSLHDSDGDGYLSPTDIVRGLATFELSAEDTSATEKVNQMVMKHMLPNGNVHYTNLVRGLANDDYIAKSIQATNQAAIAASRAKRQEQTAAADKAANGPQLRAGVTAQDLRQAQTLIKDKLMEKYSNVTQAFRSVDRDGSGYINRKELADTLRQLNLSSLRTDVIDNLVDFIDCENNVEDDDDNGPTDIQLREFTRAFGDEDIMKMRSLAPRKRVFATPPPTPPPHNSVPTQLSNIIKVKFKPSSMRKAFDYMDSSKNKTLSRAEVKRAISMWGTPLTDEEMEDLFKKVDSNNDNEIDYQEFLNMVEKSPALIAPRELEVQPSLRQGVRSSDMRKAQQTIKAFCHKKYKGLSTAFKAIDQGRKGAINREDILAFWQHHGLITTVGKEVAENIIDFIDIDDGGSFIEYKEFARVLSAEDVMTMAPLKARAPGQTRIGYGMHSTDDLPNAMGLDWMPEGVRAALTK